MKTFNVNVYLLILLVIGLGIRLAYYFTGDFAEVFFQGDQAKYMLLGINLVDHNVYSLDNSAFSGTVNGLYLSSTLITPGYPFLIAAVYWFAGDVIETARFISVVQIVLGSLTPCILFLIAVRFVPQPGAFIACVIFTLYPHQVVNVTYILTEPVFGFLISSAILLFLISLENKKLVLTLLAGCILGYATLVRPIIILLTPFLFVVFFSFGAFIRSRVFLMLLCTVLMWSPWVVWSKYFADLKQSNVIKVVAAGSYPDHTFDKIVGYPNLEDPGFDESIKTWGKLTEAVISRYHADPVRMITWYLFGKPITMWRYNAVQAKTGANIYPVRHSPYNRYGLLKVTEILAKLVHQPIFYGSVIASLLWVLLHVIGIRREENVAMLLSASLVSYVTLFHIPLSALSRFSIPFQGFAILIAVFIIVHTIRKLNLINTAKQ